MSEWEYAILEWGFTAEEEPDRGDPWGSAVGHPPGIWEGEVKFGNGESRRIEPEMLLPTLAALGNEGWELVAVTPTGQDTVIVPGRVQQRAYTMVDGYNYVLKRQMTQAEPAGSQEPAF